MPRKRKTENEGRLPVDTLTGLQKNPSVRSLLQSGSCNFLAGAALLLRAVARSLSRSGSIRVTGTGTGTGTGTASLVRLAGFAIGLAGPAIRVNRLGMQHRGNRLPFPEVLYVRAVI